MRELFKYFFSIVLTLLALFNAFEVAAQSATPSNSPTPTASITSVKTGSVCIKVGTPKEPMPSACASPLSPTDTSTATQPETPPQPGEKPPAPTGEFVYYCQGDQRWDNKTECGMGQAGCGPTSLAMIFSSFGNTITPPEMLAEFNKRGRFVCASFMVKILEEDRTWLQEQGFTVGPNLVDRIPNKNWGPINLDLTEKYIKEGYLIIASSYTFQDVSRGKTLNHIFVLQNADSQSNSIYLRDPQNCNYGPGQEKTDNPNYNSRKANGDGGIEWAYAFPVGKI